MSAFSVGFAPGKVTPRSQLPEDHPAYSEKSAGSYMEQNSLLEVSAVSIPANPHALAVRAKHWGLSTEAEPMPLPPATMAPPADNAALKAAVRDELLALFADTEDEEIQQGLDLFVKDSTPADEPASFEALFTQGE